MSFHVKTGSSMQKDRPRRRWICYTSTDTRPHRRWICHTTIRTKTLKLNVHVEGGSYTQEETTSTSRVDLPYKYVNNQRWHRSTTGGMLTQMIVFLDHPSHTCVYSCSTTLLWISYLRPAPNVLEQTVARRCSKHCFYYFFERSQPRQRSKPCVFQVYFYFRDQKLFKTLCFPSFSRVSRSDIAQNLVFSKFFQFFWDYGDVELWLAP